MKDNDDPIIQIHVLRIVFGSSPASSRRRFSCRISLTRSLAFLRMVKPTSLIGGRTGVKNGLRVSWGAWVKSWWLKIRRKKKKKRKRTMIRVNGQEREETNGVYGELKFDDCKLGRCDVDVGIPSVASFHHNTWIFHLTSVVYLDHRNILLSPIRQWHCGKKRLDNSYAQNVEADSDTRQDERQNGFNHRKKLMVVIIKIKKGFFFCSAIDKIVARKGEGPALVEFKSSPSLIIRKMSHGYIITHIQCNRSS